MQLALGLRWLLAVSGVSRFSVVQRKGTSDGTGTGEDILFLTGDLRRRDEFGGLMTGPGQVGGALTGVY